jgi:hypothetical protein
VRPRGNRSPQIKAFLQSRLARDVLVQKLLVLELFQGVRVIRVKRTDQTITCSREAAKPCTPLGKMTAGLTGA